jgi:hypothetical protein
MNPFSSSRFLSVAPVACLHPLTASTTQRVASTGVKSGPPALGRGRAGPSVGSSEQSRTVLCSGRPIDRLSAAREYRRVTMGP